MLVNRRDIISKENTTTLGFQMVCNFLMVLFTAGPIHLEENWYLMALSIDELRLINLFFKMFNEKRVCNLEEEEAVEKSICNLLKVEDIDQY